MQAQTQVIPAGLILPFSSFGATSSVSTGRLRSRVWGLLGVSHSLLAVALYQSSGSVSLRLINVQSEVYYEPPGFNYYTITQSISCHFIFMAFIMPLYVHLPHFVLEGFHLISWVLYHSSHLPRFIHLRSPPALSTLLFHRGTPGALLFCFLVCVVLLSLATVPQFARSALVVLFLVTPLTRSSHLCCLA